jgi:hypothetical protein
LKKNAKISLNEDLLKEEEKPQEVPEKVGESAPAPVAAVKTEAPAPEAAK